MFAVAILAALFADPVDLDGITVDAAQRLDGKLVAASFIPSKPSYTLLGMTVLGAADRGDGIERTAVLAGNRLDLKEGERTVVVGTLLVFRHEATTVNGVFVPGWVEIRVEQDGL